MEVLYALFSEHGKYLSLDPATNEFKEVGSVSELRIWDYQTFNEPEIWFMGNSPKPAVSHSILPIPEVDSEKLG